MTTQTSTQPGGLRAFHGNPAIKAQYVARVRAHRLADEIGIPRPDEIGIPRLLARLKDGIFEALPGTEDIAWPEAFLMAIPVGADLSLVWPRFFLCLATDETHGLLRHVETPRFAKHKEAIQPVITFYEHWIAEEKKPAAYTAADSSAYAAAASYAAAYASADAADFAAYAADCSYASADYSYAAAYASPSSSYAAAYASSSYAAYASSYAAASFAAYDVYAYANAAVAARQHVLVWQSETLLRLLGEAPICEEVSRG